MGDDIDKRITNFTEFHNYLIKEAPEGYTPWLFPVEPLKKNPDALEIFKRAPSKCPNCDELWIKNQKGTTICPKCQNKRSSWEMPHARLTFDEAIILLKIGANVGISARKKDPLVIIDVDHEGYLQQLPIDTLVVRSRKRAGLHGFFWKKDDSVKINLPSEYGEIRADNQYVLAAGSYVPFTDKALDEALKTGEISAETAEKIKNDPNRGYYTIEVAKTPRHITLSEVPEFLRKQLEKDIEAEAEIKNRFTQKNKSGLWSLKVADIVEVLPKTRVGHPLHESDTDANFSISDDGCLGHCWRHLVSLNAVQFLCVKSGYAKCLGAGTPHKGRGVSKIKGDKKAVLAAWKEAKKMGLLPEDDPHPVKEEKKTKQSKPSKDLVKHTSFLIDGDKIIEQIYNSQEDRCYFLIYDNNRKKVIEKKTVYQIEDQIYMPINDDGLRKNAIRLASDVIEYGSGAKLVEEIKDFIYQYLDMTDDFLTFAAYYVLLTYVYDKLDTLPYLRALGDTGTGKSRFLTTISGLCYKICMVSGCITPAPIYRIIEKWGGAIALDEADFGSSDEKNEIVKILNSGFQKGTPVIRCDQNDASKILYLPTYCPKIIATRRSFSDTALESRCITEVMLETNREDVPRVLPKRFFEKQQELRNKLLMFRLRNYFKIDGTYVENIRIENILPRLEQATNSFLVMFYKDEALMKQFKEFLIKYNQEIIEERANSVEGMITNAIMDLLYIKTHTIRDMNNITITNQEIKDRIFESNKYDIYNVTLGKTLKSIGIKNKPLKIEGIAKRTLILEINTLLKLSKRYILDNKKYLERLQELQELQSYKGRGEFCNNPHKKQHQPPKKVTVPPLSPHAV